MEIRDMRNLSKKYWILFSVWTSTSWDSFNSNTPCAIVSTMSLCLFLIFTNVWQNLEKKVTNNFGWKLEGKKKKSILSIRLGNRLQRWRTHLSRVLSLTSTFSNCMISSNEVAYKLLTIPTLGIFNKFSGNRWISFIMLANRTGNSFLKNIKDFLSQALRPKTFQHFPLIESHTFYIYLLCVR